MDDTKFDKASSEREKFDEEFDLTKLEPANLSSSEPRSIIIIDEARRIARVITIFGWLE